MGFHQPPTIIFDDPHTQTTPRISPHIHQKMRKRCKNNYITAFSAVYWAKKRCFKKILGGCKLQQQTLWRTRVKAYADVPL